MALPTTYTGRQPGGNIGAAPQGSLPNPTIDTSGLDKMLGSHRDLVLSKRQDEKEFLSALETDPIQLASEKVMTEQAGMLEEYENKWTDVLRQRGGKLSIQDKAMMRADQQKISAWQGQKQSDYKRYLMESSQFSPRQHDRAEFDRRTKEYLETGRMPVGGLLAPAAMPYEEYLTGLERVAMGTGKSIAESPYWDAVNEGESYTPVRTESQARRDHAAYAFSSDNRVRALESAWNRMTDDEKLLVMDKVDENNNKRIDDSELQNAVVEADFQRNKHMFLRPRTGRFRSESQWQYDRSQSTPESVVSNVLAKGGGDGVVSGTRFDFGTAVSSTFLGTGAPGIVFNHAGLTSGNKGWIPIPTDIVKDVPEGVELGKGQIDAKPSVAANGKIEWVAKVPVYTKSSASHAARKSQGTEGEYINLAGGGWVYKEEEERPITTLFKDSYSLIDTSFPGFSDLYKKKGFNTGSTGQDWSQYEDK